MWPLRRQNPEPIIQKPRERIAGRYDVLSRAYMLPPEIFVPVELEYETYKAAELWRGLEGNNLSISQLIVASRTSPVALADHVKTLLKGGFAELTVPKAAKELSQIAADSEFEEDFFDLTPRRTIENFVTRTSQTPATADCRIRMEPDL